LEAFQHVGLDAVAGCGHRDPVYDRPFTPSLSRSDGSDEERAQNGPESSSEGADGPAGR
jgi:hypothetical protein